MLPPIAHDTENPAREPRHPPEEAASAIRETSEAERVSTALESPRVSQPMMKTEIDPRIERAAASLNGVSTFPRPQAVALPAEAHADLPQRIVSIARDPRALEKVLGGVLWLVLAAVVILAI